MHWKYNIITNVFYILTVDTPTSFRFVRNTTRITSRSPFISYIDILFCDIRDSKGLYTSQLLLLFKLSVSITNDILIESYQKLDALNFAINQMGE